MKIIRNAIRCKKCGEVIESKSVHDFKFCSCGACAVDGGHEYLRRCGELEHFMERMEGLQVLEVLDREICGKYRTVAGWDPSKIVVSTMRAEDFHGEELAETEETDDD